MTFVRRKLSRAANAPCQPWHNNSYPRTGGSKNRNSWNPRNPPKFTKSSVYISL